MSEAIQATFIGGSRDLTRQALFRAEPVLRFPMLDGRRSMSIAPTEDPLNAEAPLAFGYEEYRREYRESYSGQRYVLYFFSRRVFANNDQQAEIKRLREIVKSREAEIRAAEDKIERARAVLLDPASFDTASVLR